MKVQIHKISSNHDNLSQNSYVGYCTELPRVGYHFEMNNHYLHTTKVIACREYEPGKYTFGTQNSVYSLTVLTDHSGIV